MTLKTQGLQTLEQIRTFLDGAEAIDFKIDCRQGAYEFITETRRHFRYERLGKSFRRVYTTEGVHLLAEVDALHGQLSGPATRKLCERAFKVFGDIRFARLADISNGQI